MNINGERGWIRTSDPRLKRVLTNRNLLKLRGTDGSLPPLQ
jgi:hypothetical protein